MRQTGHAGTLDPMAKGVLIVAIGAATKLIEYLAHDHKSYTAHIRLGITTNTYDADGTVIAERPLPPELDRNALERIVSQFVGDLSQIPPPHSAVKVEGKRAYTRARAGEVFQLRPRQIHIYHILITRFESPLITLDIECSTGTYIRSLAHDLGTIIGCGATLIGLVRTQCGDFHLSQSLLDSELGVFFARDDWGQMLISPASALRSMPFQRVTDSDVIRLRQGQTIELDVNDISSAMLAYAASGDLVAVLRLGKQPGVWRPEKVFPTSQSCASEQSLAKR